MPRTPRSRMLSGNFPATFEQLSDNHSYSGARTNTIDVRGSGVPPVYLYLYLYLRYTCFHSKRCTCIPVGTCLYLFGNRLVPVGTCFPALCISGLVVDTLILSLRSLRCQSKVGTLDCYRPQKIKPVFYLKPVYLFQFRSGTGVPVS